MEYSRIIPNPQIQFQVSGTDKDRETKQPPMSTEYALFSRIVFLLKLYVT